jgi:hypothetical protein
MVQMLRLFQLFYLEVYDKALMSELGFESNLFGMNVVLAPVRLNHWFLRIWDPSRFVFRPISFGIQTNVTCTS